MKKIGLMLGGGGVVGIAWEIGVAAGLQEAAGFDPGAMDVIVGSSAGSAAGALLTLGKPMDELVAQQRRTPSSRAGRPGPSEAGGRQIGTRVVPTEIMRLLISREGSVEERARAIGPLALAAPVAMTDNAFVASFERMFGTDEWPEQDLRITTADCESGASVLLSKEDGIALTRAVACSCAIPGYFPPISANGRRYMDGPRGGFSAELVEEKGLDAVLFIGPLAALPKGLRTNPEIDELAAKGLPVVQLGGGRGLEHLGADLMDAMARARAVDAGIADGKAMAAEVAALLG